MLFELIKIGKKVLHILCGMGAATNDGMETADILKKILDGSAMRHRALANNIANAETPGYGRRDVTFISELKSAIESGDVKSVKSLEPELTTDRRGEGIELEKEFAALAQNQLLYQTSAELLSRKYAGLRKAITGRV
jgi:flagellar basal-body rod protein FlgB